GGCIGRRARSRSCGRQNHPQGHRRTQETREHCGGIGKIVAAGFSLRLTAGPQPKGCGYSNFKEPMPDQADHWSRAARDYEKEFIDPYGPEVRNPLLAALGKLADPERQVAADLGCGIGPLLPFLSQHFRSVYAVDFAEGMLARAKERCRALKNVKF